ncbi:hypothetical protein [Lentzea xinjiangensis]|uniref:hypothetical protein n=1 Tax=Lentzea xinjiangensis TaxID=402600 RepID=UPI00116053A4|nr:hypothetical protein [Lentzea xinjiangensis]
MAPNELPRQPKPLADDCMPEQRKPGEARQPVPGQPVSSVDWFRRMPTGGGTVFLRPAEAGQD